MPPLKTKGKIHETLTGYDFRVDPPLTRARAIRQKCLECQCGSASSVKKCAIHDCTLWPYRLGRGKTADPDGVIVKTASRTQKSGEGVK